MSWRQNISWRWIVRGMCLGLLGLCVGVWGLSYFCLAGLDHGGRGIVILQGYRGQLTVGYEGVYGQLIGNTPKPYGWSTQWATFTPDIAHWSDAFPGFTLLPLSGTTLSWTNCHVVIPLWCPTVLLSFISWIAWRKTGRGKTGRGFSVGPMVSRQESDGG